MNECLDGKFDNEKILPQGATTDVGLHTGGQPRKTTFPLILAVIRYEFNNLNNDYKNNS